GRPDNSLPPSPGRPDQGLPGAGTPGHPDQGLPGTPPSIDNSLPMPPATIWPPLPPGSGINGKALILIWIVGVGYRWLVAQGVDIWPPPLSPDPKSASGFAGSGKIAMGV